MRLAAADVVGGVAGSVAWFGLVTPPARTPSAVVCPAPPPPHYLLPPPVILPARLASLGLPAHSRRASPCGLAGGGFRVLPRLLVGGVVSLATAHVVGGLAGLVAWYGSLTPPRVDAFGVCLSRPTAPTRAPTPTRNPPCAAGLRRSGSRVLPSGGLPRLGGMVLCVCAGTGSDTDTDAVPATGTDTDAVAATGTATDTDTAPAPATDTATATATDPAAKKGTVPYIISGRAAL